MSTFIYRPRPKDRTGKLNLKEVLEPYAEYAKLVKEEWSVAEETELISSTLSKQCVNCMGDTNKQSAICKECEKVKHDIERTI